MEQRRQEPRLEAQGKLAKFNAKDDTLLLTLEVPLTADRAEEATRLMMRGAVLVSIIPVQISMADAPATSTDRQGELALDTAPELCVCNHLTSKHTVAEGVVECWADAVVGEGRCKCREITPLEGAEDTCGAGVENAGCGHYRRLHDPAKRLSTLAHVTLPLAEQPASGFPLCFATGVENPCMCQAFVEPAIPAGGIDGDELPPETDVIPEGETSDAEPQNDQSPPQ